MYVCMCSYNNYDEYVMHAHKHFLCVYARTTEPNWILPGLDFLIHNFSAGPEILFSMEYKIHIYMHKV